MFTVFIMSTYFFKSLKIPCISKIPSLKNRNLDSKMYYSVMKKPLLFYFYENYFLESNYYLKYNKNYNLVKKVSNLMSSFMSFNRFFQK